MNVAPLGNLPYFGVNGSLVTVLEQLGLRPWDVVWSHSLCCIHCFLPHVTLCYSIQNLLLHVAHGCCNIKLRWIKLWMCLGIMMHSSLCVHFFLVLLKGAFISMPQNDYNKCQSTSNLECYTTIFYETLFQLNLLWSYFQNDSPNLDGLIIVTGVLTQPMSESNVYFL